MSVTPHPFRTITQPHANSIYGRADNKQPKAKGSLPRPSSLAWRPPPPQPPRGATDSPRRLLVPRVDKAQGKGPLGFVFGRRPGRERRAPVTAVRCLRHYALGSPSLL